MSNSRRAGGLPFALWLVLAACPGVAFAQYDLAMAGGDQTKALTTADLQNGAGSDFAATVTFPTTFTIQVTSPGACQVSVARTGSGWLSAGNLLVAVVTNGTCGPPVLVDTSDHLLLTSATALQGQTYTLLYKVQGLTVENQAGTYSALVTYTVTAG
jgi:hypothetical protein